MAVFLLGLAFFLRNAHLALATDDLGWLRGETPTVFDRYRVIPRAFFVALHRLFGPTPFAALVMIFLFHTTNALLVHALARRLLQNSTAARIALVAFFINPITLSTLTWFSCFSYVQGTTLALLALLAFCQSESARPRWAWCCGALACYGAGLLCSHELLFLPACFAVLGWLWGGPALRRGALVAAAALTIGALVNGCVYDFGRQGIEPGQLASADFISACLSSVFSFGFSLGIAYPLSFFAPTMGFLQLCFSEPLRWTTTLALVGALLLVGRPGKVRRLSSALALCFAALIAPYIIRLYLMPRAAGYHISYILTGRVFYLPFTVVALGLGQVAVALLGRYPARPKLARVLLLAVPLLAYCHALFVLYGPKDFMGLSVRLGPGPPMPPPWTPYAHEHLAWLCGAILLLAAAAAARWRRALSAVWALGLVLAVGTLLRLWGVAFGYPGRFRPDENFLVDTALRVHSGDLNPHFFNYPSLYTYLLSAVLLVARTVMNTLHLAGGFETFCQLNQGAPPYVIARVVTAVIGVIGVHAVYRLGRIAFSRPVGLLAALLLALNFSHVRESHFATTDVALTCLMTHALASLITLAREGRSRDYVACGVLAGLAAGTKYTGFALAVPFVLAHVLFLWQHGKHLWARPWLGRALLGGALILLVFIVVSPYLVLDFATARQSFSWHPPFIAPLMVKGASVAFDAPPGLSWLLGFGLRYAAGVTLEILLVTGCALSLWLIVRRGPPCASAWLVLTSQAVTLAALVAGSPWAFLRYVLPLMPIAAVFAAALVHGCATRLLPERRALGWAALLLMALTLEPTLRTLALLRLFGAPDTRQEARTWIAHCLPPGSEIATTMENGFGKPLLPPKYRYRDILRSDLTEAHWVLLDRSPVKLFSVSLPESLAGLVRDRGRPVARFDPFVPGLAQRAVYDPSDAFYVPVAGFDAVRSPGPTIELYAMSHEAGLLLGDDPSCRASAPGSALRADDTP